MKTENKIYSFILQNNMFGQNLDTIIIKCSKMLGISSKKVVAALKTLYLNKNISVKNRIVINNTKLYNAKIKVVSKNFGKIIHNDKEYLVFDLNGAKNRDKVEYYLNNKTDEVIINKVIEHSDNTVIGQVVRNEFGLLVFIPDDRKNYKEIAIFQNDIARYSVGKKCIVKLLEQNSEMGQIEKTFGNAGDPIAEIDAIAFKYNFVKEFPSEVMQETLNLPTEVSESEKSGRLDLTDKDFITIDPATCKDMDDALYIESTDNGFKVFIAISDVSHYVKPSSSLNAEGYNRGTSCYLGDSVYPMYPSELSNGICSLNEKVDRLVICAIVDIDKQGKIVNYEVAKGVINSKHKLSYEQADDIHFNKNEQHVQFADIKNEIDMMYKASDILQRKRHLMGSLFFNTKEPTFKFNDTKTQVIEVKDDTNLLSRSVIENFMVLANEVVAMFFIDNKIGTLYRVHESPTLKKQTWLRETLKELNVKFNGDFSNFGIQQLLKSIENYPNSDFLNSTILRVLAKAHYQPKNVGHFGLALDNYLHFTAPIRRYPDTLVHSLISAALSNQNTQISNRQLEEYGEHLSEQEVKASEAEMISDQLLYTVWAETHADTVHKGYVHSLSEEGVYVKIGLIRVLVPTYELENGKIADYKLSRHRTTYTNNLNNRQYHIGDEMEIKIYQTDRNSKVILASTDLSKPYAKLDIKETVNNTSDLDLSL